MQRRLIFLASVAISLLLTVGVAAAEEAWFECSELNTGLGPAPDFIDRSTPRATIETLYKLAADKNWTSGGRSGLRHC